MQRHHSVKDTQYKIVQLRPIKETGLALVESPASARVSNSSFTEGPKSCAIFDSLRRHHSGSRPTASDLETREPQSNQRYPAVNLATAQEAPPKIYKYCQEIAAQLNPKQPDIVAAIILQGFSYWQNNNYQQTLIDDRRYSFRSLSELQADYPYFSKSSINKALKRLQSVLKDEFLIRKNKAKGWYSIGDKTLAKIKKGRIMTFFPADAIATDNIRAAVLMGNLRWALLKFIDPKTDAMGNKYVKLSPKTLCPILHFSEDTISRLLADLCKEMMLVRHSKFPTFYALADGFVGAIELSECPKTPVAEVNSQQAKVDKGPAERHRAPADVNSQPAEVNDYPGTSSNAYRNECVNESSNEDSKGRDRAEDAALPAPFPSLHIGFELLKQLVSSSTHQSKEEITSSRVQPQAFSDDDLPNDDIAGDLDSSDDYMTDHPSQLYEYIPERRNCVDREVEEICHLWMRDGYMVDQSVRIALSKFFYDNLDLFAEDLYGNFHNMIHGPFLVLPPESRHDRKSRLLKKVNTPKAFMKYLPQIVALLDDEDSTLEGCLDADALGGIIFNYPGLCKRSSIVPIESDHVDKMVVADDFDTIRELA